LQPVSCLQWSACQRDNKFYLTLILPHYYGKSNKERERESQKSLLCPPLFIFTFNKFDEWPMNIFCLLAHFKNTIVYGNPKTKQNPKKIFFLSFLFHFVPTTISFFNFQFSKLIFFANFSLPIFYFYFRFCNPSIVVSQFFLITFYVNICYLLSHLMKRKLLL